MSIGRSIKERFEQGKPLFSVEFFPPKDDAGGERMLETAAQIQPHQPDFVSITYGAGGGTRATTMRYARLLKEEHGFEVMPHLTCVGHTREELLEILEEFSEAGFRNVMALRGDPPKGETTFKPVPGGLSYGSDLVALIRENFPDFGIGVGGYPEKHPEASDFDSDLDHLKIKVDAGADFITTSYFSTILSTSTLLADAETVASTFLFYRACSRCYPSDRSAAFAPCARLDYPLLWNRGWKPPLKTSSPLSVPTGPSHKPKHSWPEELLAIISTPSINRTAPCESLKDCGQTGKFKSPPPPRWWLLL